MFSKEVNIFITHLTLQFDYNVKLFVELVEYKKKIYIIMFCDNYTIKFVQNAKLCCTRLSVFNYILYFVASYGETQVNNLKKKSEIIYSLT